MSDVDQCVNGEPPKTAKQLAKEAKKKDKLAKFDAKKSKINEKKEDVEVNYSCYFIFIKWYHLMISLSISPLFINACPILTRQLKKKR